MNNTKNTVVVNNMENNNFKKMEENALRTRDLPDYWITPELNNKGWLSDSKRIYIPFKNTTDNMDNIYLSISRKNTKKVQLIYVWCLKKQDGTFTDKGRFKRNILINEEEINKNGESSINKILSNQGSQSNINTTEEGYKNFFKEISNLIINSDCLDILKNEYYEFTEENEPIEDEYILEIQDAIEYRKNPTLDDAQKQEASKVSTYISKNGLIDYLKPKLDNIHLGEHRNLYRKLLGAFNVMRGKGSYLFETTAHAEEGKSLEDIIVFSFLIPEEYIFKMNKITEASFIRNSEINPEYYTRLIITLGDFGSKKAYQKIEDVFDIIKILITEKEYFKDLSEKNTNGTFTNKKLDLIVESIGAAYSTTINSFTENDSQLESRTLSSTPFDTDKEDIIDLLSYLNTSFSQESKKRRHSIESLVDFKSYLLSLVTFDKEIINPYGSVFKRYVIESNTPIREFQHLLELFDAYCVLTHAECDIINDTLVASEQQLNTFLSDICLENVLIPYESNFIKMLLAKNKKTELVVIDEPINEEEFSNPLQEYFNDALESMTLYENESGVTSYTELDNYRQPQFINKLLELYRLGGTSSNHKGNVFFRLSDIKRIYYRYKVFKDIDDVGKLLHILQLKGYLGKLDFSDPNNKQNIYYITSKCENITVPVELNEDDKKAAEKYLNDIGLG